MLSNLSPVKKLILGLAAMCIAVSVITANNLSSIMILVAARNNANNNAAVQTNAPQSDAQQSTQSGSSSAAQPNSGTSADTSTNSSSGTDSSNTGSSSNTGTDANKPAADANKPADDANKPADSGSATGKPSNNAEIAAMYNKAINNAKTNAKTITRVKDGAINYNNIVEAGGLSDAASSLMGMFMVSSPADIQVKNEPWEADKFPPENAQAALAESGIKSAKCDEEDGFYILTITAKNESNPKSGGPGVGSLCGVIQEETITGSISSVPGLSLSNINIDYENVTVIAKIEKSTGNIVNLQIDAPCILSLSAKLLVVSIDNAKVGIEVITEYSLEY